MAIAIKIAKTCIGRCIPFFFQDYTTIEVGKMLNSCCLILLLRGKLKQRSAQKLPEL
jgi:hypothetical protein